MLLWDNHYIMTLLIIGHESHVPHYWLYEAQGFFSAGCTYDLFSIDTTYLYLISNLHYHLVFHVESIHLGETTGLFSTDLGPVMHMYNALVDK